MKPILFYMDHYTLKGKTRNWFEKSISYSVLFSKIYLLAEHRYARYTWEKQNPGLHLDVNVLNQTHLKQIANACDSAKVPYVFIAIPMPTEASLGKVLKEKYKDLFGDIKWYVPENLSLEDYDGKSTANHFNNKGHLKYSEFLKEVLHKEEQGLNK